ncbi:MAG: hypothetical protein K0Q87_503 [Neobacillus sp.]|jgi:hypothetical protein|nr:hypothetical protein [Neobacillus sp.]
MDKHIINNIRVRLQRLFFYKINPKYATKIKELHKMEVMDEQEVKMSKLWGTSY